MNLVDYDIKIEECVEFLGVHLDSFLKWYFHIEYLSENLCCVGFTIRRMSKYLSLSSLKTVYLANFECLFRYGIMFWASSLEISRLFDLQKRVLRYIFKMTSIRSCRKNRMLTIFGCFMFFFKNKSIFLFHTTNSDYPLRSQNFQYAYLHLKSIHIVCVSNSN